MPHTAADLQPLPLFKKDSHQRSRFNSPVHLSAIATIMVIVGAVTIGYWQFQSLNSTVVISQPTVLTPTPKPSPTPASKVAGATTSVTFGDILARSIDFSQWLVGVDGGTVQLINPANQQTRPILKAEDAWHGPISDLYWSPDKSKVAALYLSKKDAQGMAKDAQGYAKSLGLEVMSEPTSFPYGQLVIIDLVARKAQHTGIEIKNSAKSLAWVDNNQLTYITSTVNLYRLNKKDTKRLISAGSTDSQEQLRAPVVWSNQQQQLYFIKSKQFENGTIQILTSLNLDSSAVKEIREINYNDSQGGQLLPQEIDIAVSPDGKKLALVGDGSLSYLSLSDLAQHQLPYDTSRRWLSQATINDLQWLSSSKLVFTTRHPDGQVAATGWDQAQNLLTSFAKGSLHFSWSNNSGQLAIIDSKHRLIMLEPDWHQPEKSEAKIITSELQRVFFP